MTLATFSTSIEAQQAAALLEAYRFDLGDHDARQWVSLWLQFYRPVWVRDAVIEALYQGRYKSISVRQILELWTRRGKPIRHVTHEFESAVCREFGEVRIAPGERESAGGIHSDSPAAPVARRSLRRTPDSQVSFDLAAMTKPSQEIATETQKQWSGPLVPSGQGGDALPTDNGYHYTSRPISNPTATLQAQRQYSSTLGTSARAIQPFKPALPFSAQTLRLARQKTTASLADSGN